MWFHLGFQNFVAKKNPNDVSCEIFVSDFVRIWHKSLSNDELLSISKKLNPLFEAPVQKLKDLTLNLFGDVKVKKEIKEENNSTILVRLESNIMNVKFQFDLTLNQGNEELFYKEFTLPLLLALVKTQNREKKLIEIIKQKDAEIKDYKQSYGIAANYLTTKPFSIKEFHSQEASADIYWDNSFLDCLNATLCAIEAGPQVKEENLSSGEKSEKMQVADKSNNKKTIFKDKSINQKSSGSKPCLFLDSTVIKKRKKHNDGYKIKI